MANYFVQQVNARALHHPTSIPHNSTFESVLCIDTRTLERIWYVNLLHKIFFLFWTTGEVGSTSNSDTQSIRTNCASKVTVGEYKADFFITDHQVWNCWSKWVLNAKVFLFIIFPSHRNCVACEGLRRNQPYHRPRAARGAFLAIFYFWACGCLGARAVAAFERTEGSAEAAGRRVGTSLDPFSNCIHKNDH